MGIRKRLTTEPSEAQRAHVLSLLEDGKVIRAVRYLREEFGLGLAAANNLRHRIAAEADRYG